MRNQVRTNYRIEYTKYKKTGIKNYEILSLVRYEFIQIYWIITMKLEKKEKNKKKNKSRIKKRDEINGQ